MAKLIVLDLFSYDFTTDQDFTTDADSSLIFVRQGQFKDHVTWLGIRMCL